MQQKKSNQEISEIMFVEHFFLTFDFFIFSFHFFVFTFSAPNIRESISSSCHVDYINMGSVCCG